jgi:hypothetical protein
VRRTGSSQRTAWWRAIFLRPRIPKEGRRYHQTPVYPPLKAPFRDAGHCSTVRWFGKTPLADGLRSAGRRGEEPESSSRFLQPVIRSAGLDQRGLYATPGPCGERRNRDFGRDTLRSLHAGLSTRLCKRARRTKKVVVCTSASKTSTSGAHQSNIVIPDGKLRAAFSDRYQMDTSAIFRRSAPRRDRGRQ